MMMNKATSRKDQLDPRQGDGQQPSFPPGPTVPDPGYGAEAVHHRDEHAGGRPEQDHEGERQHADGRHRLDLMDLVLNYDLRLRRQELARGCQQFGTDAALVAHGDGEEDSQQGHQGQQGVEGDDGGPVEGLVLVDRAVRAEPQFLGGEPTPVPRLTQPDRRKGHLAYSVAKARPGPLSTRGQALVTKPQPAALRHQPGQRPVRQSGPVPPGGWSPPGRLRRPAVPLSAVQRCPEAPSG